MLERSVGVTRMVLLAFTSSASFGCLSNEYRISTVELARLTQLPPEQRGERVRVVQELGEDRPATYDAVHWPSSAAAPPAPAASAAAPYPPAVEPPAPQVYTSIEFNWTGGASPRPTAGSGGGLGTGSPVPGQAQPRRSSRSGGGGGGGFNFSGNGGGGGGGNGAEALVVLAVVVVAVAVMAAAGLFVTEGMRYDGFVRLLPNQPLHLIDHAGGERVVALGDLYPEDLLGISQATVIKNEGHGPAFIGRAPLDRKGFAFKLDFGPVQATFDPDYTLAGLGSNIQFGYFPAQRFGLLTSMSLTGGTDGNRDSTFARHSLGLEAQVFPVRLGRLHLGLQAHGGMTLASALDDDVRSGPAWGGGALVEIDLTTRMGFTIRGDVTRSKLAGVWHDTTTVSAGLAVY